MYNWKKTQNCYYCPYKFILAKNIIFVSSDDLHPQIKRLSHP